MSKSLASEKKILVVDDEPDIRNFISTALKDVGFNVDTAENGMIAFKKIKESPPDLMTLDVVMPVMSGLKLIKKLKKHKHKEFPIIVITAHSKDSFGSEDCNEIYATISGHKHKYFIEKPITFSKLTKVIHKILNIKFDENEMLNYNHEREKMKEIISNCDDKFLSKIKNLINHN